MKTYRDDNAAEAAIRAAVAAGELPPQFSAVFESMPVYNATGGCRTLWNYWPAGQLAKVAPWLGRAKEIVAPFMAVARPEDPVPETVIGTVRNDGPVDVVSCTGQWIGSDDSGGWFGGD